MDSAQRRVPYVKDNARCGVHYQKSILKINESTETMSAFQFMEEGLRVGASFSVLLLSAL